MTFQKFGFALVLLLILTTSLFASVKAAILVDADANGHWTPRYPADAANRLYFVGLTPSPAVPLGPGAGPGVLNLLQTDFLNWTFINAPARPGVLNVVHYDADVDRSLPNVFTVDYVWAPGAPPAAGWVWQWIQIIITNDPVPAAVAAGWDGFYVDPQPNDDPPGPWFDMPFYWTEAERIRYTAGGANCPAGVDIRFVDRPSRPLADAPVSWIAYLYLVYWNQLNPGTVHICDGIAWGFEISWIEHDTGPNISGGVAGDKFESEMYGIHTGDPTYPRYTPKPVGGIWVPVDKFGLLAPHIGFASTILAAAVATVIFVKRRKEKQ